MAVLRSALTPLEEGLLTLIGRMVRENPTALAHATAARLRNRVRDYCLHEAQVAAAAGNWPLAGCFEEHAIVWDDAAATVLAQSTATLPAARGARA